MKAIRLLFLLVLVAMPAVAKDGYVTTSDGVKLHYIEEGSGPAILFIPGWTMPAEIWQPQIDGLRSKFRVVALSPRSQGKSDTPAEGHYPERRALDIKETITQLKLAPVVLVGWSMGVPELMTFVDKHGTADLRGLVLVDGQYISEPQPAMAQAFHQMLLAMQKDRKAFTTMFVRSMYRKPQSDAYLKEVTEASLRVPTTVAHTTIVNYLGGSDMRPIFKKVDKPVLYVYASPMLKAQAEELLKLVPPTTVEVFESAGHALFVDEADKFNALIERFVTTPPKAEPKD